MLAYKNNLVSVIMPAFNTERYISDAVESVLNQTYQNFELIIVNDGSTDKTEDILKKYSDRIRYIYQNNKGVSAARNRGILASKGEYIAFLDSDDIWLKNALKLQIDYLTQKTDIDLVYGEKKTFDKTGISDKTWATMISNGYNRPEGYIFKDLIFCCLVSIGGVMFRKKILDVVGLLDENLPVAEDYDLWLRIAANHKIGYIPEVLCLYRRYPTSLSATNYLNNTLDIKVVERALEKFPGERDKIPFLKLKKQIGKMYFQHGYAMFNKGQHTVARLRFKKSLLVMPFNIRAIIYYIISHFPVRISFFIRDLLK